MGRQPDSSEDNLSHLLTSPEVFFQRARLHLVDASGSADLDHVVAKTIKSWQTEFVFAFSSTPGCMATMPCLSLFRVAIKT